MKRVIVPLMTLMVVCTGCASDWYLKPEKFQVKNDRLNKVEIRYQATEESPRIRCEMKNNGYVQILEGHSVTVGDDFNIEYDKPTFGDVRKYTYSMDPEMFRDTLQLLVDSGLLERVEMKEDDPVYPKVLVRAMINGAWIEKFTADPKLIAEIRMLLTQFKRAGYVR